MLKPLISYLKLFNVEFVVAKPIQICQKLKNWATEKLKVADYVKSF